MIYVGIDLGGMSAKSAVFKDGELLLKERVETSPSDGFDGVAKKLAELAQSVVGHAGLEFSDVAAVGIGSPGVIDGKTGVVAKWSNYSWKNVPLGERVAELTKKPVYVTNDANAAALGEAKFGAGAKYDDCILITLGTGVGSGIVIDGKLFEGYKSAGGEAGHMTLVIGGKKCGCGRRGCFEQYASATALMSQTREAMFADEKSLMWEITGGSLDKANGATPFTAARFGDKSGQKVVDNYIAYLGEGIANLVNIFRPQAVMLGGGVSNAGDELLNPLKAYVESNIMVDLEYAPLDIVLAKLGNDAGVYGAYAYAMQREEDQ